MIKNLETPAYFKESLEIYARDKDYDAFFKRNICYEVEKQANNCKCFFKSKNFKPYPMRPDFLDYDKKTPAQERLSEEYLKISHSIYHDNKRSYEHLKMLEQHFDHIEIKQALDTHNIEVPHKKEKYYS